MARVSARSGANSPRRYAPSWRSVRSARSLIAPEPSELRKRRIALSCTVAWARRSSSVWASALSRMPRWKMTPVPSQGRADEMLGDERQAPLRLPPRDERPGALVRLVGDDELRDEIVDADGEDL